MTAKNLAKLSVKELPSPYSLTIEIPGLPRMTNRTRVHWSKIMRHAAEWKGYVRAAVLAAGGPPKEPLGRAKLILTRYSSVSPDFDGLVSSFKHCVDGLKAAGVLSDDKVSVIGAPEYRWEKVPIRQGKIKMEVYEVKNA